MSFNEVCFAGRNDWEIGKEDIYIQRKLRQNTKYVNFHAQIW